jgi:hypothetical protein
MARPEGFGPPGPDILSGPPEPGPRAMSGVVPDMPLQMLPMGRICSGRPLFSNPSGRAQIRAFYFYRDYWGLVFF